MPPADACNLIFLPHRNIQTMMNVNHNKLDGILVWYTTTKKNRLYLMCLNFSYEFHVHIYIKYICSRAKKKKENVNILRRSYTYTSES